MTEQQIQAIIVRGLKTFAQVFIGVFLLGITSIIQKVLETGTISGSKSALLALIAAAVAAGISAAMNAYIKPVEAK
jgi:hypothetical protein